MFYRLLILALSLAVLSPASVAAGVGHVMGTFEFPPYAMKGLRGEASGPFVEIVEAACREMGEECRISLWPNRRAKKMVNDGKLMALFPLGWNEQRAGQYYFSVPLVSSEYGFFVRRSSEKEVRGRPDLQGLTVAVFSPSNTYLSLLDLRDEMSAHGLTPFSILTKTNASGSILRMLEKGRFDAYYSNRDVGLYQTGHENLGDIRYAWGHKPVLYFVGFPKQYTAPEFVRRFNQTVLKMMSEHSLIQSVLKSHFLTPATITPELLQQYQILH